MNLYNYLFKDKEGNIVIAQKPNLPLIVWFSALVLSKIPFNNNFVQVFELVSYGAIFTWAWMEIYSGINPFRKLLGMAVIIFIVFIRVF